MDNQEKVTSIQFSKNTTEKSKVSHNERASRASSMSSDSDGKSVMRNYLMRKMNLIRRSSKSNIVTVQGPPYHTMTVDTVADLLKTDIHDGLSDEAVEQKRTEHGNNEMEGDGGVNPVKLMLKQFFNVMVLILLIAMVR
jgi:magnesium-transporting ATPase (P-type)